jgi:thiamine pyrophosphokinase
MAMKRAWIFVNGELGRGDRLKAKISSSDWIVAVDAGYRHLKVVGLKPDLVLGDLDSLSEMDLQEIQQAKIPIQRFPPAKDETDLELALNAALDRGCRIIRIACAGGGRLDQLLANLALLARPDLAEIDLRIEDGVTEAFLIRSEIVLTGDPGDIVSLLPVGGQASGVVTEGLLYPLHSESLWSYRTRGISNVMQTNQARIQVRDGILLCVHIRN